MRWLTTLAALAGTSRSVQPLVVLWLTLLASSVSSPSAVAEPNTASVVADGYSFSLRTATASNGTLIFLTTFDGLTVFPLADCPGATCTVSDELRPVSLGSNIFVADYFAVDAAGDVFEYGELTLTINSTDIDGDGVLDALEIGKTGNFGFSGSTTPHFNAFGVFFNSTVSGNVSRSAGVRQGSYSGTFQNPSASASISGAFALSGASGSVQYDLGGDTLLWSVSNSAFSYSGISTLMRDGTSSITVPGGRRIEAQA